MITICNGADFVNRIVMLMMMIIIMMRKMVMMTMTMMMILITNLQAPPTLLHYHLENPPLRRSTRDPVSTSMTIPKMTIFVLSDSKSVGKLFCKYVFSVIGFIGFQLFSKLPYL